MDMSILHGIISQFTSVSFKARLMCKIVVMVISSSLKSDLLNKGFAQSHFEIEANMNLKMTHSIFIP